MAPSLSLAEFPPVLPVKESISPSRSQSLASNTTGSAQDILDTTDGSENEGWHAHAGDATQHYEPFSPPPLLATTARRRSLPHKLDLGCEMTADAEQSLSVSPCRRMSRRNFCASPGSPQPLPAHILSALDVAAAALPSQPQALPAHILAALDAAVAASPEPPGLASHLTSPLPAHVVAALGGPAAVSAIRPPPGLELPPGLEGPPGLDTLLDAPPGIDQSELRGRMQDSPHVPSTRYQTPPRQRSERAPARMLQSPNRNDGLHSFAFQGSPLLEQFSSPCQSPLDQFMTPFSPPANLASPWSQVNVPAHQSPAVASPGIFSTTPMAPQSGTPVPAPPATWGLSAPPQHAARGMGAGSPVPPPPASWAPGAQSMGLLSPMALPPASWGNAPASPAPPLPASWGAAPTSPAPLMATQPPAAWGGMPSCPPPSWPAPASMECPSSDAIWMDQDMRQAMPGVCNNPLKVFMEHLDCEALPLERCFPVKKGVPEWL